MFGSRVDMHKGGRIFALKWKIRSKCICQVWKVICGKNHIYVTIFCFRSESSNKERYSCNRGYNNNICRLFTRRPWWIFREKYDLHVIAGVEAVSSMTTAAWPPCVYNSQPHKPSGLILAQIIPANGRSSPLIFILVIDRLFFLLSVLGNVVVQLLQVCSANKIQVWMIVMIFFRSGILLLIDWL